MSQQQFAPGPQQSEDEEETYAPQYPYSWTGKSNAQAAPRDEPPSSSEYEAGYQAQNSYTPDAYETPDASSAAPIFDAADSYSQQAQQTQQQDQQPYQYNPYDGTYGQGNDPYNYQATQNTPYQQGIPQYARPQQQSSFRPWRFSSILLILVIISILSTVGRGFAYYGGYGLEWIFGMLFPLLIVLMILNGIFRSRGGRRYWRGPWRW
jgi:hypothetical protein